MKTNPVKRKLRRGEPSFGSWLSLESLQSARVLARSGLDWLTLDMEHSAIDWSTAAMGGTGDRSLSNTGLAA
jgi:4-hydroxy-2-oxoheptanedioate aldolase